MVTQKGVLTFLACAAFILISVEAAEKRNSKDWDYILFTQQWPPTQCLQWKSEGRGHSCALPKRSTWTVHGVWPTKNNTKGPSFCNNSLPFDEEALSPILTDLENYWINVDLPTPIYSFWKHEWEKHGTCAAALPAMDKEVKYFSQGISWLKEFNVFNALDNEGIYEGKSYLVKNIRKAVNDFYGKVAQVHCYRDDSSGKTYLMEIRLCFDKSLKMIDCPKPCSSNCPNTPVEYPSLHDVTKKFEVKGKWLLDLLRIVRLVQWITY